MIKLIATTAVIGAGLFLAVNGINSLLTIDDLKGCDQPDILVAKCAPADAIVAVSGGDTVARTAEAIKLYNAGWAPKLVFSGAAQDTSGPSNAEAMRRQAIMYGVPQNAISLDKNSVDTNQNAKQVQQLLGSQAKRVILVTSPYHQRRAWLEFQRQFMGMATIINHPTPTDRAWGDYWWLTFSGWVIALTETVKTLFVMVQP